MEVANDLFGLGAYQNSHLNDYCLAFQQVTSEDYSLPNVL